MAAAIGLREGFDGSRLRVEHLNRNGRAHRRSPQSLPTLGLAPGA